MPVLARLRLEPPPTSSLRTLPAWLCGSSQSWKQQGSAYNKQDTAEHPPTAPYCSYRRSQFQSGSGTVAPQGRVLTRLIKALERRGQAVGRARAMAVILELAEARANDSASLQTVRGLISWVTQLRELAPAGQVAAAPTLFPLLTFPDVFFAKRSILRRKVGFEEEHAFCSC